MHLQFERQKHIGPWTADAYVPYYHAVVECRGDYYHCNPTLYPGGPINGLQQRAVEKDARRTAALTAAGYHVIALWERAINTQGAQRLLELALLGRSEQERPAPPATDWSRSAATTAPTHSAPILVTAEPGQGEAFVRAFTPHDAAEIRIHTALQAVRCSCKRGLFQWEQDGRFLTITVRCPRKTCASMPRIVIELEPF